MVAERQGAFGVRQAGAAADPGTAVHLGGSGLRQVPQAEFGGGGAAVFAADGQAEGFAGQIGRRGNENFRNSRFLHDGYGGDEALPFAARPLGKVAGQGFGAGHIEALGLQNGAAGGGGRLVVAAPDIPVSGFDPAGIGGPLKEVFEGGGGHEVGSGHEPGRYARSFYSSGRPAAMRKYGYG